MPVNASATVQLVRNGQMRTISVSSPQRLGGVLAQVPTWTEQGIKSTMTNFREVRYAQLAAQDEWKKDPEANLWAWNFLDAAKTSAAVANMPARWMRWSERWVCARRLDTRYIISICF